MTRNDLIFIVFIDSEIEDIIVDEIEDEVLLNNQLVIDPTPLITTTETESNNTTTTVTEESIITNPIPTLKIGYISKLGQERKNWKERFFVLENGSLIYYEKPIAESPYGYNKKGEIKSLKNKIIKIQDYSNIHHNTSDNSNSTEHVIVLDGGTDRSITLKFKYLGLKLDWIESLQQHIIYANNL